MNKHEGFILREKERVDFDVNNPEHIEAIALIDMECRQHPTLRFAVRPPFLTVVDMARHDIAMKAYQDIRSKYANIQSEGPGSNAGNVVVPRKPVLRAIESY